MDVLPDHRAPPSQSTAGPMRSFPRLCLAVLLVALLAAPAAGQDAPVEASVSQIDGTSLQPVTLAYNVAIEARGQSRTFEATRTLTSTQTNGRSTWTVTDRTALPQATITDSLVLQRSTLRPISRRLSGPMTMTVSYTDTAATGTLQLRGRSRSIDASFDRPTLAGGANVRMALAALPLRPGFSATLHVFNEQQQATQTLRFEVTGQDSTTTPAGTFDTYAVSIRAPGDGLSGTMHVRQAAPHHIIQSTLQQPGPQGERTFTRTLTSMETPGSPDGP